MGYIITTTSYNELYHHGVKGQKWGVRRYQNADGTLTSEGKQHKSKISPEKKKELTKKAILAAATAVTVTAAVVYAKKHPEAIGKVLEKVKNISVKDLSKKTVDKGKQYIKDATEGVKAGIKEGIKEAPKKAAKVVVTGVVLNATKRALDKTVGKDESTRIFQANDNKKIGKFWKVQTEDRDD